MEIRLISHASVVIRTDVSIWTDPWLFGKAFNDSWSLLPPPAMDESLYKSVNYIFISHEHPDHFHIPTLKSLPEDFKNRVTILFQDNNSDKVFKALIRLGYPNTRAIPHDKLVELRGGTKVYCYQAGSMDSALGVIGNGKTVLNVVGPHGDYRMIHFLLNRGKNYAMDTYGALITVYRQGGDAAGRGLE